MIQKNFKQTTNTQHTHKKRIKMSSHSHYFKCEMCQKPMLLMKQNLLNNDMKFKYNMFVCLNCNSTLCHQCEEKLQQQGYDCDLDENCDPCPKCNKFSLQLVYYNNHNEGYCIVD